MEKLDGVFNQGYRKALQDIISELERFSLYEDMKAHGIFFNKKNALQIIKLMLKYREDFRDDDTVFIRCNKTSPTGFEVFSGKTREVIGR